MLSQKSSEKYREWAEVAARAAAIPALQVVYHPAVVESGTLEECRDKIWGAINCAEIRGFEDGTSYFKYLDKQHPEQFLERLWQYIPAWEFLEMTEMHKFNESFHRVYVDI